MFNITDAFPLSGGKIIINISAFKYTNSQMNVLIVLLKTYKHLNKRKYNNLQDWIEDVATSIKARLRLRWWPPTSAK